MTRAGRAYTPSATRAYEDSIRLQTRVLMAPRRPTKEPCIVYAAFFLAFPASWNVVKQKTTRHSVRPDLDNLVKSVLDGICGERMAIRNDSQIIEVHAFKTYSDEPSFALDVWEVTANSQLMARRWRDWK